MNAGAQAKLGVCVIGQKAFSPAARIVYFPRTPAFAQLITLTLGLASRTFILSTSSTHYS